jgi:hypothetical protein
MTTNEPTSRAILFRKIAAVAGAVGSAAKDGRNKDQNYSYATPASVINAVKPHMAEQGIAIVPHLVEFAEIDTGTRSNGGKSYIINRVSMHYHILDGETGEEMIVPWQAQAGTYGDDKGLAKAQTIALRTFLLQLFQVPAEDPEIDPDARDARPVGESTPASFAPRRSPPNAPQQPDQEIVKAKLAFLAFATEQTGKRINSWQDALGWWGTQYSEPQTVEEWRASGSALRAEVKARTTKAPLLSDEYDAIEASTKNGATKAIAK